MPNNNGPRMRLVERPDGMWRFTWSGHDQMDDALYGKLFRSRPVAMLTAMDYGYVVSAEDYMVYTMAEWEERHNARQGIVARPVPVSLRKGRISLTRPSVDLVKRPELTTEWLREQWADITASFYRGGHPYREWWRMNAIQRTFIRCVRRVTRDSTRVVFCPDCEEPTVESECSATRNDALVCDVCIDGNYSSCYWCEQLTHTDDMTEELGGQDICEYCRDYTYRFCDTCDGYYHRDDHEEHTHRDDYQGNCCESPAQTFRIPNDGDGMLANDTRATITLPAGIIDAEGIRRIQELLMRTPETTYSWRRVDSVDPAWQTRRGNFTKRLSRELYERDRTRIPAAVVSEIGCIAREHSSDTTSYAIETTRNLNLPPEDFAHEDSCWWQSYYKSRCALKSHGGFGLRSFDQFGDVTGRAWVMPLKSAEPRDCGIPDCTRAECTTPLVPTFNTESPAAYVVFNGYGALNNYIPARILAHMTGMTYRKLRSYTCEPMYVNGPVGYLVSTQDVCDKVEALSFNVNHHDNSLFESESANVA